MRRFLLAPVVLLAFACAATPANAAPVFSAPAASTTYSAVHVGYSLGYGSSHDFRLEFTYTGGANATPGNVWTVALNTLNGTYSFDFAPANPTAATEVLSVTPSAGATGTTLPEGTYSVVLKYDDSFGIGDYTSPTHTGVVVDTHTAAPVLTSPVSSASTNDPTVAFTLPEDALAGSVRVTYTMSGHNVGVTLDSSFETAGAHSVTLNPANIAASTGVASTLPTTANTLIDGTYLVTVRYQDEIGNTNATQSASNVVFDTTTQSPTFTAPATSGLVGAPFAVTYTLPEAALSGSLQLAFTGAATSVLTLSSADGTAAQHSFSLDPANLSASGHVVARSGVNVLPSGTYSLTISYRDALGNPVGQTSVVNVVLDSATQAGTFTKPYASSPYTNVLDVEFALSEAALNGSVALVFTPTTGSAVTVTLAGSQENAATHSFTLDTHNLLASPQVASATGSGTLPDGTYDVALRYRDVLGNAYWTSTHTAVRVDSVSELPTLDAPAAGTYYVDTLPMTFTFPETGFVSAVRIDLVGAAGTTSLRLNNVLAGSHTLALNRADLAATPGVVAVDGPTTLPDGTYTVRIYYRDEMLNPEVVTAARIITLAAPGSEPELPVVDSPKETAPTPRPIVLAPYTPAKLAVTWAKPVKAGSRWTLRATFAPQPGAKRYTLVAAAGKKTVRGVCRTTGKAKKRRVACTVKVAQDGRWKLTASAVNPRKLVVATGAHGVRLH